MNHDVQRVFAHVDIACGLAKVYFAPLSVQQQGSDLQVSFFFDSGCVLVPCAWLANCRSKTGLQRHTRQIFGFTKRKSLASLLSVVSFSVAED